MSYSPQRRGWAIHSFTPLRAANEPRSYRKFGGLKERFLQPLVPLQVAIGFDGCVVQMVDIVRHEVRQGGVFGVTPQRVDGV